MKNKRQLTIQLFFVLFITACATTPIFDTSSIDLSITPEQAANNAVTLEGSPLLWGGIIINSTNLKEETQLEVLAYPLDSKQKPDVEKQPLGRFLAIEPEYLETSIYSQGRSITVSGTLQINRIGRIGEAEYTYPVLKINQLQLWKSRGKSGETRFHFGVGVMFHN
jgi:outer membrane lipoprotein